jgi:membrane protein required for colicin V production
MTTLDIVLLSIITVSAVLGLMRGFIGVLASMLAWVLASWVAFYHGVHVALLLANTAEPTLTELLEGYALCFVGVLLLVGLVGWAVGKLVKGIGLSALDRLLGFGIGLLRGGFVACALLLLLGFTGAPHEAMWKHSRTVPVLLPGALWLRGWLPDWVAEQIVFGNAAPTGDNGGHNKPPLPVPLDEGVRSH